jgi:predicted ATPase
VGDLFLKALKLKRGQVPSFKEYPFSIPTIHHLEELRLESPVTFFIGENGTGKSTLLEAIAVCAGFNALAHSPTQPHGGDAESG